MLSLSRSGGPNVYFNGRTFDSGSPNCRKAFPPSYQGIATVYTPSIRRPNPAYTLWANLGLGVRWARKFPAFALTGGCRGLLLAQQAVEVQNTLEMEICDD